MNLRFHIRPPARQLERVLVGQHVVLGQPASQFLRFGRAFHRARQLRFHAGRVLGQFLPHA